MSAPYIGSHIFTHKTPETKSIVELALECGWDNSYGFYLTPEVVEKLKPFYLAAIEIGKAQGADEFKASLGEPVAWLGEGDIPTTNKSRNDWWVSKSWKSIELYALKEVGK